MTFQCPECQASKVEIINYNPKDGMLECECRECGWCASGCVNPPDDLVKEIINGNGSRRLLISVPEEVGMGTKRIAPTGHGHHVYIDQKMMIASGVDTGDIVHILIWKSIRGG